MRIQNFFFVATVAIAAFLFSTPEAQAQQTREHILLITVKVDPQAAGYVKIGDIKGECQLKEGRNVIGKNTRNGDEYIAVVQGGKLSEIGVVPKGGSYKVLPTSSAGACDIRCRLGELPKRVCNGGVCFCVCGVWLTTPAGPGN